jgi:small-conductance mechanosensitive channel
MIDTILKRIHAGDLANPATPLGALLYAVLFAFFAWIVARLICAAVHRALAHDTHAFVDRTTATFLAQLARVAVYIFAFISYAHLVPALTSLGTAWLASVSVISVIVGIAAQSTLGNLIAGISLLIYRPFKTGDRLEVTVPGGVAAGVVESLNLGYTVMMTDDDRRIIVPNNVMASQTIIQTPHPRKNLDK